MSKCPNSTFTGPERCSTMWDDSRSASTTQPRSRWLKGVRTHSLASSVVSIHSGMIARVAAPTVAAG